MKKPKKQIDFREDIGKLLLDLGKLTFGGIIIGGILHGEVPPVILVASGSAIATILFVLGLHWTAKKKKGKKE
jgi:uncharacterized membrane protein YraQ (UPF0718 family)